MSVYFLSDSSVYYQPKILCSAFYVHFAHITADVFEIDEHFIRTSIFFYITIKQGRNISIISKDFLIYIFMIIYFNLVACL